MPLISLRIYGGFHEKKIISNYTLFYIYDLMSDGTIPVYDDR